MKKQCIIIFLMYLLVLPSFFVLNAKNTEEDKFVVYYFHGNKRCFSCNKIEALSNEAIQKYFAKELQQGQIEWKVINIDKSENKHFIDDFQLYTKSLIVSKQSKSKVIRWKNLKNIWILLNDQTKFYDYVHDEMISFMKE
ncbi:conserved hypothetical protein, secreted [Candidatus Magnetomorum sp. HK-1]|nr:conserved hypothetical protein, secreted [Candidatus Magnetomorum sp. HK-1]